MIGTFDRGLDKADLGGHHEAGEEDGAPVVVAQAQAAVGLLHQALDVHQRHDDALALQLGGAGSGGSGADTRWDVRRSNGEIGDV